MRYWSESLNCLATDEGMKWLRLFLFSNVTNNLTKIPDVTLCDNNGADRHSRGQWFVWSWSMDVNFETSIVFKSRILLNSASYIASHVIRITETQQPNVHRETAKAMTINKICGLVTIEIKGDRNKTKAAPIPLKLEAQLYNAKAFCREFSISIYRAFPVAQCGPAARTMHCPIFFTNRHRLRLRYPSGK